ncbi:MAG: malto-oligosyltrehalose trehalohydrolase [Vicinamibacterales bacterium]
MNRKRGPLGGGRRRYQPRFGAWPERGGTRFSVWAPAASRVRLAIERGADGKLHALERGESGIWAAFVEGAGPGTRYFYRLDDLPSMPDPASRFQPLGVHGPSEVVAVAEFPWSDSSWHGVPLERLVFYELHVGTFTRAGTYDAATKRIPYLADLGVTAIELMPLAEFPGTRNWGYDGAAIFAPAHEYGHPDDLRSFVDRAHAAGLAVFLDVVYNHLGPDGAYLAVFVPPFFSSVHASPWGESVNLDKPGSGMVREFLLENVKYWLNEFHFDGLRLDATHALVDESPRHFLADVAASVHSVKPFNRLAVAEDDRNLVTLIRSPEEGGYGLDAVWADDFHHQAHRMVTGEADGYYRDYDGTPADLARTIADGWLFQGQHSEHLGGPRGTPPTGVSPERLVICLQNHDQVGNRAFGERLNHLVDAATFRAASVLLLLSPQTPLLFMGQEWAAGTPFVYFTDHEESLGTQVTEGRRQEFAHFEAFSDPHQRGRIPDPQQAASYESSRLCWEEIDQEPHASTLRLYRTLLHLRAQNLATGSGPEAAHGAFELDGDTLLVWRIGRQRRPMALIVRLRGADETTVSVRAADLPPATGPTGGNRTGWRLLLTTEDPLYAPDPHPPVLEVARDRLLVRFARPSAVVLLAGSEVGSFDCDAGPQSGLFVQRKVR